MNLGCWGEIVTTYNPNTRVVFLCTHLGTLELSWPLEKEVPYPWFTERYLLGGTRVGEVLEVQKVAIWFPDIESEDS